MNQQERASELNIIVAHISSVKDDLDSYVYRLSEAKCKKEADKLLSVIGRLEQLQWEIARHCEK